jgi:hypothetical protein
MGWEDADGCHEPEDLPAMRNGWCRFEAMSDPAARLSPGKAYFTIRLATFSRRAHSPLEPRHEGAAMRLSTTVFFSVLGVCSAAWAIPVASVPFADGNVLNIVGVVGSGPDTAYLAVDFSNNSPAGPSFAWQFNWTEDPSNPTTELQMLMAIPGLTVVPDPTYGYDFIDNFNYGTNTGSAVPFPPDASAYSYWASYVGQDVLGSVNWVFAPNGADQQDLGYLYDDNGNLLATGVEGLIYGWTVNGEYQTTNLTPDLPETAVPEPASLSLLLMTGIGLLTRRRVLS